jgi:hypothetical protein
VRVALVAVHFDVAGVGDADQHVAQHRTRSDEGNSQAVHGHEWDLVSRGVLDGDAEGV